MTRAHRNGQSTDDRILLALKRGPQTVTELSRCLQMTESGVRYALNRLLFEVDCRLVPGMERRFTYRLSPEGEQRVVACRRRVTWCRHRSSKRAEGACRRERRQ